jgi:hypothetical protein
MPHTVSASGIPTGSDSAEIIADHPFSFAVRLFAMLCMACTLGACSSSSSVPTLPPMYSTDKQLSCEELQLEINEANFFLQKAEKSRGITVGSIFSPIGYASKLMDAEDAIETSQTRIEYLNRIAEIKQCGRNYARAGLPAQEQAGMISPVAAQQAPSAVMIPAPPPAYHAAPPTGAQPVGQMVRGADGRMWIVTQMHEGQPVTGYQ